MAGVREFWRESATLLLASKRLPPTQPAQSVWNKITRTSPEPAVRDVEESLRLLLMKRHSKSRFMPDTYVFPGGMLDNADFSKDWIECLDLKKDSLHFFHKGKAGSDIFSRKREQEFSLFPAEVALRLAAIRETFEESGILLARPASEVKSTNLASAALHPLGSSVHGISDDKVLTGWRERISKDSSAFLAMCREMEVVPDIWSLYEWANWLTPTLRTSRFDTAFFIGCVDEAPPISVNTKEMDLGVWVPPSSMLKVALNGVVSLAPPQTYELSRLIRFGSVDDLLLFSCKRSDQRVDRCMPVIFKCADGIVFCLPGDDLYPDDPDFTGERKNRFSEKSQTFAELQEQYANHHRAFVSNNEKVLSLYCNLDFVHGHILPLETGKLRMSINS